jgi:phosphatidylglycerol:prolipoprotein diacylglycerol transferase
MYPRLIEIGGFAVPTYGVLVATAFLVGVWLAGRLARAAGLDRDTIVNLGIYTALAGVAGAKLLMVALEFDLYRENPRELFSLATLQAAGIFYGGLIAALAVGTIYIRKRGLPLWRTLDVFAPALALGHGIGRLGCLAAGCCWGIACDRRWALTFTHPEAARFGTPLGVPLHPTQAYEALGEFAILFVLLAVLRRKPPAGQAIALYLALYAALRFVVEYFRAHLEPNPWGGPLSDDQWISIALFAAGGALLWLRRAPAKAAIHSEDVR